MWPFGCNSFHGRKKIEFKFKFIVNERLVFIFSTILRKFYLIIVCDLKVKYTINNFLSFHVRFESKFIIYTNDNNDDDDDD